MPTPSEDRPDDKPGSSALALLVVQWLLAVMTLLLVADYASQIHAMSYHIPPFIVDLFVETCQIAMGATAIGAGVTVLKLSNKISDNKDAIKRLENKDEQPPK